VRVPECASGSVWANLGGFMGKSRMRAGLLVIFLISWMDEAAGIREWSPGIRKMDYFLHMYMHMKNWRPDFSLAVG